MSLQDKNRDLVVDCYRRFEKGDYTQPLVSPALVACVLGQTMGREQWLGFGRMFMEAFPDLEHVWETAVGAGDWVLLNGHFTGTHKAPFMGIPATGRRVKVSATIIDKVIDGKLVEHRGDIDTALLMRQLTEPAIDPRGVVEALIAKVDAQDWDAVRALVSSDCKVQVGAMKVGRDGWEAMGRQFYAGFPDGKNTIEDVIVAGDRVILRGTWSGTHRAEFQGLPPTGRRVTFSQIHTYRVRDGLIVEHHGEFDAASMMQQLTQ